MMNHGIHGHDGSVQETCGKASETLAILLVRCGHLRTLIANEHESLRVLCEIEQLRSDFDTLRHQIIYAHMRECLLDLLDGSYQSTADRSIMCTEKIINAGRRIS